MRKRSRSSKNDSQAKSYRGWCQRDPLRNSEIKPQVSLIQGKTARVYLYLSVVKHADREGALSVVGRERTIRHF